MVGLENRKKEGERREKANDQMKKAVEKEALLWLLRRRGLEETGKEGKDGTTMNRAGTVKRQTRVKCAREEGWTTMRRGKKHTKSLGPLKPPPQNRRHKAKDWKFEQDQKGGATATQKASGPTPDQSQTEHSQSEKLSIQK